MLKKLFVIFFLVGLLFLPLISLAQAEIPRQCVIKYDMNIDMCPAQNNVCSEDSCGTAGNQWGWCCIMNTVYTVSNWIFYIVILFSTIMIVWGGFTYLTSAGDPGKAGKGKSIITYALIGLAVALLAKVMPSVLKFFLGL
jgi:hypothetical protein